MSNRKKLAIGVGVGIVAIGGLVASVAAVNMGSKADDTAMSGMDHSAMSMKDESESAMFKEYNALKGEAFDKAYVSNMIVHHESALNMAEQAQSKTERQEIRDLTMSIMNSQSAEIVKMRQWQTDWGYPATSGHMMTDSANAGMSMEGMADMSTELKDLSGAAFDKKFLELMIQHHQDAVDMSRPAATNASHQEVKDIAMDIIAAQKGEIDQMRAWQQAWGY